MKVVAEFDVTNLSGAFAITDALLDISADLTKHKDPAISEKGMDLTQSVQDVIRKLRETQIVIEKYNE